MSKQLQRELQQDFLSQYSNRRTSAPSRLNPHPYLGNEVSQSAQGVKWVQSKNIYILAVVMAFFLYQCDRIYDLRRIFLGVQSTLYQKSRRFTTSEDPEVYVDQEWIFGLSLIILSLVISAKRVFAKRVSPFSLDEQS